MQEKCVCPFEFSEFASRELLDLHLAKCHTRALTLEIGPKPSQAIASSGSFLSLDDSSPEPATAMSEGLSIILGKVILPKNPLSEFGELSENRILRISNSPSMNALCELKLSGKGLSTFDSNNRISVKNMSNLTILDLSSNYIFNLCGVGECKNLSYLNVSNNLIEDLSPLQNLLRLSTLKLSNNKVKDISNLGTLKKLAKLKLNNNLIFNFDKTLRTLATLPKLVYLTIQANPCIGKTKEPKEKILKMLRLEKLDKVAVDVKKNVDLNREKISLTRVKLAAELANSASNADLLKEMENLKSENSLLKKELSKIKEFMKSLNLPEV